MIDYAKSNLLSGFLSVSAREERRDRASRSHPPLTPSLLPLMLMLLLNPMQDVSFHPTLSPFHPRLSICNCLGPCFHLFFYRRPPLPSLIHGPSTCSLVQTDASKRVPLLCSSRCLCYDSRKPSLDPGWRLLQSNLLRNLSREGKELSREEAESQGEKKTDVGTQ